MSFYNADKDLLEVRRSHIVCVITTTHSQIDQTRIMSHKASTDQVKYSLIGFVVESADQIRAFLL